MNLAKQHRHVALKYFFYLFLLFFFVHKCLLCILHGQCTIIQFQQNLRVRLFWDFLEKFTTQGSVLMSVHHVSPYKDWYRERSWVRMTVQV